METTKDKDIYTLTVSSTTVGKNSFTITLYDYEKQKIFPLTVVEFTVTQKEEEKELIPDTSQTKIISQPKGFVNENDTVTLEFQLFGKDKKPFDIPKKDLGYLKVYINDKEIKDAEISLGKDTYIIKINPEEYGNNQKVNVYYDDGKNKVKLFKNDCEYELLLYPLYTKTEVECSNCETISIDDKLNMSIYLYNYKGKCVEKPDYSDKLKVEVKGPIDDESKVGTKNYKVKKVSDSKLKCQNKYEIVIENDDKYEDYGNYEINVYQGDMIIYNSIQSVIDLYLPDPTKTKLIHSPKEKVEENQTVFIGLELYNEDGQVLKLKDNNNIKIYINDKEIEDAKIHMAENGTYIIEINPERYGPSQKLNIYYDNGKDKVKLLENDVIYELILKPDSSKTEVECLNCDDLNIGNIPLLSFYLYNYKGICVEGGDFSELFNIEINGPYELTQNFKVRKALEFNLKCKNKYIISVDKELFIYEGKYEIKVYQKIDIIYDNNVNVIDNSIPCPENTEIINGPPSSVKENETVKIELNLYDENRNLLTNRKNYLDRLSIYINGKKCEDADISLSNDGKSFIFSFKPDENSANQKVNFVYNDGKNTIQLLPEDLEFKVQLYPFPTNNKIICTNCGTIAVGDKLSMFLYLYNFKNICVDKEDFSSLFHVVLEGPLEDKNKFDTITFYFEKDINPESLCQNEYRLNPLDHKYLFEGKYKIHVYQEDKLIVEYDQILIMNSTLCNSNNSIISEANEEETNLGTKIYYSLKCFDYYGNQIKLGGEKFTAYGSYQLNGKMTSFNLEVIDLKNGEYQFGFVPSNSIEYTINIYQNEQFFKEYKITKNCDEEKPILCPNKNKCVKNKYDCLDNDCPIETPFYCKVNNEYSCVESQIECDCPENFVKCGFMNYCVPSDRKDMCPDNLIIQSDICSKFKNFPALCNDGICRMNLELGPSQKVCPIGSVLCADLSCRNNYNDCFVSEYCEEDQIRCVDQTCVNDPSECPSTVSCAAKGKYVCPDGRCVLSEVDCDSLPLCTADKPYRCHDNFCAINQENCLKSVSCGHKMALCSDLICRTSCP